MPNWCSNYVHIQGNKTVTDKIRKGIENEEGLFKLFYPIPEELNYEVSHPPSKTDEEIQALTEKHGAGDWYTWSLKKWGCKWDARDIDIQEDKDDCLYLTFNTPWGPPIDFYKNLAKDYKVEMSADYYEEGMEFCGKFLSLVEDGEVYISEDERNIGEMRDDILSRYIVINKHIEATSEDFLEKVRCLYEKIYPEVNDYYDSEIMFNDFWLECEIENDEFCKQYGIIR